MLLLCVSVSKFILKSHTVKFQLLQKYQYLPIVAKRLQEEYKNCLFCLTKTLNIETNKTDDFIPILPWFGSLIAAHHKFSVGKQKNIL